MVSGRNAAEQSYKVQEYLDREYNYKFCFFLVGVRWAYVDVTVGVQSRRVRNQSVDI